MESFVVVHRASHRQNVLENTSCKLMTRIGSFATSFENRALILILSTMFEIRSLVPL